MAGILQGFKEVLLGKETSIASCILQELGIRYDRLQGNCDRKLRALLYAVYKVLSCTKYPSMSAYGGLSDTDLAFKYGTLAQKIEAIKLTKNIVTEHSHITLKIEQTRNFLKICDNSIFDNLTKENGVSLSKYWELLEFDYTGKSIMEIARHLPPPFIVPKIQLIREKDNAIIDISKLSAGERQFYNITSAVTYHLINLLSVNGAHDRVPYKNALVVMDEVELCFHPEYQRTFVDSLIKLIHRLGINKYMNIHFMLTTHSPFILSDIPKENILYLEDGISISNDSFINPFAANINDVLSQSFFLNDKGFMGEFAKQVVLSAIDFLSNGDNNCRLSENYCNIEWDKEKLRGLIELIGEPLVKRELSILYAKKFSDVEYLKAEMERLSQEINAIEN